MFYLFTPHHLEWTRLKNSQSYSLIVQQPLLVLPMGEGLPGLPHMTSTTPICQQKQQWGVQWRSERSDTVSTHCEFTVFIREVRVCLNTGTQLSSCMALAHRNISWPKQHFSLALPRYTQVHGLNPTIIITTKSSLVRMSTVCTSKLNGGIKLPQGWVVLRRMRAKSTYKARELSKPLQHQLWMVSGQPLDKQGAKDLHRLRCPQNSIQWFWQTFKMFRNQMKEKKWNKINKAWNLTSHNTKTLERHINVISRCFCGRSGTAVLSPKCHWCLLSQMNSLEAMWAMLWLCTGSLKNLSNPS